VIKYEQVAVHKLLHGQVVVYNIFTGRPSLYVIVGPIKFDHSIMLGCFLRPRYCRRLTSLRGARSPCPCWLPVVLRVRSGLWPER
jgi:hypothetical protein